MPRAPQRWPTARIIFTLGQRDTRRSHSCSWDAPWNGHERILWLLLSPFLGSPIRSLHFVNTIQKTLARKPGQCSSQVSWDLMTKQGLSANALLGRRISEMQERRGRGKEPWEHGETPAPPPSLKQCFTEQDATSLNTTSCSASQRSLNRLLRLSTGAKRGEGCVHLCHAIFCSSGQSLLMGSNTIWSL